MERILVATDLSARSVRAMERGFRLAKRLGAAVQVLSVVDDALPDGLAGRLAEDIKAGLEAECRAMGGDAAGVAVVAGDPAAEIVAQAQTGGAGLIVMGLHRTRPFMDAVRETTMERTVRLSHLPVLLVRNAPGADYARVLCPVDFSAAAAAAVKAAAAVAPDAAMTLFHAFHTPHTRHGEVSGAAAPFRKEALAEYQAWIANRPELLALPEPELVEGGLDAVFERMAARVAPDLIAVGAHSRPALVRMLIGDFAAGLIRTPPTDLLVSHP